MKTGIADEARVHYLTVHEEKWKAATQWPPHEKSTRWFLDADSKLSPAT